MKKETLFNLAIIFIIIGITLIGLGLGCIFNKTCEGLIIGFGLGLSFSALILLKIFRRRDAYEKK